MPVKAPRIAAVQSTVAWVVILPATMLVLSLVADSLVRLLKGSKAQQVFRLVYETWPQASSGCSCVTDVDERREPGILLRLQVGGCGTAGGNLGHCCVWSQDGRKSKLVAASPVSASSLGPRRRVGLRETHEEYAATRPQTRTTNLLLPCA